MVMGFAKNILLALFCCAGFCGSAQEVAAASATQDTGEATSISQFGITWTIAGTNQTGQYANGDYWVIGPVNIISITNSLRILPADLGTNLSAKLDGSMINPRAGSAHTTWSSRHTA